MLRPTRAALLLATLASAAHAQPLPGGELAVQLESIDQSVQRSGNELTLIEKQFTKTPEPTDEAARDERYAQAEIAYLLGDLENASLLFYDLVANNEFHASPNYPNALFYLSDALYQQKNYLGARLYLKQLLQLRRAHYADALARYLEIAGRFNEFAGIDEYMNQARGLAGGQLPDELAYVYAKWLFRREDLPLEQRITRAQNAFSALAQGGRFRFQAGYFIGVGYVKLKDFEKAAAQFQALTKLKATDKKEREIQELASLSLGRVDFEMGKFDEALDHYQDIPRESDSFPESLYEIAWTHVRKGDFARARSATEILLLVAEDSPLAPEAKILQGTLLQKLQKYDEATETYNGVINTYAPVRDEIDALLTANQDPVRYFDDLLARNDKNLDVTSLLPPLALKWATTSKEVASAVQILKSLEVSRKGVEDGQKMATFILQKLDERGVEAFPYMQEGIARAEVVDNNLTRNEEQLVRIEAGLVSGSLSPEQKDALAKAKAESEAMMGRLQTLPATPEAAQARKEIFKKQMGAMETEAFKLHTQLQSAYAEMAAIQKYVDDGRRKRKGSQMTPDEKAFLEEVLNEKKGMDGTQVALDTLRQNIRDEMHNAENSILGEEALKREYDEALKKQKALFDQVRSSLPPQSAQLMLKSDAIRQRISQVRTGVNEAKAVLRERVTRRANQIRDTVHAEQALLEGYGREVGGVSTDAKDLVGRIAFDSFKRVRQSFYELVLKADVGVVDVAFTRKQDKTQAIQKLATQKDHELKQLEDEFKEVLKDTD
ncbi:MAG: tetratricopeptide repeat protein [Myxococcaceae bacterium]|nr:tetratricopeptide repeat protein [Myxococcaceae bacterium]